ncbi:MAG: hypothetical protein K0S94_232 [Nitrospira sp.]|jgi:hypothetical protein|nr:hypothetical protein [Nitrospira sp.]
MNLVRLVGCGVVLLGGMIWLSTGVLAQGDKCQKTVERLINQVEEPPNEEVSKFRSECPTEDRSYKDLQRYRDRVKEQRRLIAEAVDIVKMAVDGLTK